MALDRELRWGMQAIGAAAFTLDAFYAAVVEHAPTTRVRASSRPKSNTATLLSAFVLTNDQARTARPMLRQVFRFRDWAVHPPAKFVEPVRHPAWASASTRDS